MLKIKLFAKVTDIISHDYSLNNNDTLHMSGLSAEIKYDRNKDTNFLMVSSFLSLKELK